MRDVRRRVRRGPQTADQLPTDPLLIAEDAWAYSVPWPNEVRYDAGDAVLFHGVGTYHLDGAVSRIRFDAGRAERRIGQVRGWFAERGREAFCWWVGASATPGGLVERLFRLGVQPEPDEPQVTPMALIVEPPPCPSDVEVRRVETFDDFRRMAEIRFQGFDMPEAARAEARAQLVERWAHARADGNGRYLAYLAGEPVAYAALEYLSGGIPYLGGGATLPAARGRGAYRALVRARWDDAVERGRPMLVIQAGKESRPILERLGFTAGPPVHVLVDHSAPGRGSGG